MRKLHLALCALFISSACVADDFVLVPGKSAGAITPVSTEADLMKAYSGQVKRIAHDIGEGNMACATQLFGGTDKEMVVMWKGSEGFGEDMTETEIKKKCDGIKLEHALYVEVWPTIGADGSIPASQWKTAEGLAVGVDLARAEEANGAPVTISTSESDLLGTVMDWNKGRYDGGWVRVQMHVPPDIRELVMKSVSGELLSSSKISKEYKAKIRVHGIRVYFEKP